MHAYVRMDESVRKGGKEGEGGNLDDAEHSERGREGGREGGRERGR